MRRAGKWLVFLVCGVILAFASPVLADDDVIGLQANRQVRLGPLVLEPGFYVLRADASFANHSLIVVTNGPATEIYGVVMAKLECSWKMRSDEDLLVFDEKDGQMLKKWVVAEKAIGYWFSSTPVSPAVVARVRARMGVPVASR